MELAVKVLEDRQDEMMRKIYELKAIVDGLAEIVTTPDADLDLTVGSNLSSQSFSSTVLKGPTDLDAVLGKVRICACDFLYTCTYIFYWTNMRNLFSPHLNLWIFYKNHHLFWLIQLFIMLFISQGPGCPS